MWPAGWCFLARSKAWVGRKAFTAHLAPLQKKKWFVYAKPPFAGPEAVLAYLARYTHRVAIANSRLVSLNERGVSYVSSVTEFRKLKSLRNPRHQDSQCMACERIPRAL